MNSLHADTPIEQVAATVSEALAAAGITAVLSGGAAVQIYSEGLYVSRDLDFVSPAGHRLALEQPGNKPEPFVHFATLLPRHFASPAKA